MLPPATTQARRKYPMQDFADSRPAAGPLPAQLGRLPLLSTPRHAALFRRSAEALRLAGTPGHAAAASLDWIARFIAFHHGCYPASLGATAVAAFLDHLVHRCKATGEARDQAQAAILFLFQQVLGRDPAAFAWMRPRPATYTVPLLAEMGPGWCGWAGTRGRQGTCGPATP